ncbi:fatty-acid amide hydrolase 2-A isoform X2 [Bacillus rossius redtenbacheri]
MASQWMKKFSRLAVKCILRFVQLCTHALLWIFYHGSGEQMPPIKDLLLLDTATALALKIRSQKVTSVQVMEVFISRIKEINPILNCVVDERFEAALEEAKEVDKLIQSGTKTSAEIEKETPFLGVPFSTKDCLQVKGLCHTAGLYCRKDVRAAGDAAAIAAMRKAGAIPLALTNVSEVCMWWESNNTVHGRTSNPYNTHHIVGGSSGGEACLQAAAGSAFGIGSDIGGSIRMPAFFNGIFGHKPSKGIVSNHGQYPEPVGEQDSFLGIGPMCRFATDLVPVLRIISGKKADLLNLDEKVDVRKLKFYYMEHDGGSHLVSPVDGEIKDALRKVVTYLDKAYGIKAQKICLGKLRLSTAIWMAKMKVKGSPPFSEQLANCKGAVNVYLELLKWFLCISKHTFIGLATAITEDFGVEYGSDKHVYLLDQCRQLADELQDILGTDGVFLYPTHPTPAPYHNEPLVKPFNFSYTAIVNVLGLPATHCPLGLTRDGLPVGIQVIGSLNKDRHTLAVAVELEKAFGGWVPPSIKV